MAVGGAGAAVVWRKKHAREAAAALSPDEIFARDVHAALADRTAALRRHDEKAFLAGVDTSRPALLATARTTFRNLVRLPLASAQYKDRENATTGLASDTVPGAKKFRVALTYQIRGVDLEPVELVTSEHWIRRGGRVLVTASDPVPVTRPTVNAPIDQVALTVVDGPLVTVAGTADVTNLRAISATAERAARQVRRLWGTRPGPTRFIAFVTHDRKALATWFGVKDTIAAADGLTIPLATAGTDLEPRSRYAGARVVVDLVRTRPAELYATLRHEFTHAQDVRVRLAQQPFSIVDPYPVWAEEGLAAWSEELDVPLGRTSRLQSLRAHREWWGHRLPPAQHDLFYTSAPMVYVNYDLASLVFRYVATRWGTARALDYYVHIASGKPDAARAVLGQDPATFERGWAAWVDGLLARYPG